jgi:hypothetical protein
MRYGSFLWLKEFYADKNPLLPGLMTCFCFLEPDLCRKIHFALCAQDKSTVLQNSFCALRAR